MRFKVTIKPFFYSVDRPEGMTDEEWLSYAKDVAKERFADDMRDGDLPDEIIHTRRYIIEGD